MPFADRPGAHVVPAGERRLVVKRPAVFPLGGLDERREPVGAGFPRRRHVRVGHVEPAGDLGCGEQPVCAHRLAGCQVGSVGGAFEGFPSACGEVEADGAGPPHVHPAVIKVVQQFLEGDAAAFGGGEGAEVLERRSVRNPWGEGADVAEEFPGEGPFDAELSGGGGD